MLVCLFYIASLLRQTEISPADIFSIRVPFSFYLGWITVATIANATTLLVSVGWDRFGVSDEIWTAIALGLGVLLAGTYVLRYHDPAYGLAVLWGYGGILYKHISEKGFHFAYPVVIYTAAVCMALLILSILLSPGSARKR
jgi:hypothetical protein